MFASWLTALLLMVWIKREVAAGRSLLAGPRRWLGRIGRGHVLLALALAGLMIGLVWLMKADGAMIVAFGWPEVATVAASVDLPALVDLAIIAVLSAGQARLGTLRRKPAGARSRSRARVSRRRTPRRAANDDEDRPARAA